MKTKKKKKLKIKRIIVIILVIFLFRYMKNNYLLNKNVNQNFNILNSNYEVIKQDKNENYPGIGQEKVKNKDGYLSTFTTIQEHKKTYKEYKQNGNSPWHNKNYWGGTMSDNGCGITAISIILSGYKIKISLPKILGKSIILF